MKNMLLLWLGITITTLSYSQQLEFPHAEKIPYKTYIHNDTIIDNYFWIRDKYSVEVVNYLYANNAHADAVMKPSAILQKVIYDEMRARLVEARDTRPSKNKNYFYYSRTVKDKDYPAIFRKKDSLTTKEQLVLDLNTLAQQYMYFSLIVSNVSPNQTLYAYAIDDKGNNIGKLFIKHIDGDSLLTDTIPAITSFIWAEDNRTFYYTTPEPKTNRAYRVYRHILGNHFSTDELILEEPDKTIQIGLGKTSSKQYITINLGKTKSNEEYYLSAYDNQSKPVLFLKRKADLLYSINHYEGKEFYITTNHQAINYKLVKTPISVTDPAKWETIIPHRKNVLLQSATLLKNHLIYVEKENAQERIIIKNRTSGITDTVKTNLSVYSIGYDFLEYDYEKSNSIQYSVTNDIEPTTTYEYNLTDKTSKFIERDSINEPYQSSKYEIKRVYAPSHDGVLVPLTITYKKGLILNGNNPTLLTGYGSYGAPNSVAFSSADISFLNRGFVLASAHIRGGNDLGMQWYEDGKFLNKKNTFLDFIACAEYLINQKYTSNKRLAIQGGSAGGLLMGAVVNMRPDLFKCAVANVPFVDVINTMLDESIPLTTFEFEEWGNPKQKKYYDYMKSYSPYDNVEAKNYPALLVTAGYNDAQVGYWEPAKWVAKLRELKTDTNQVLFKTNMEGGHGGASGRYAALKERAFIQAFIMHQLGVKENYIMLKGKVVDIHNNPIEYANIYVEKTGVGTNSNTEGEFTLRLKSTDNEYIVVQSIGFEKQRVKIDMNTRTTDLTVKLKSEVLLLKTALVTADGKDPAIGIIKKSIRMRKQNYDKVNSFSADVYMKGTTKLDEIPKKIPSFLKLISNGNDDKIDSNLLGLLYLSESVAKYNFEKPDKVKETMIASRVAGEKQGFSFNRVEDVFINFYEPTVQLSYYSERPFVSPIAPLAMLNYKYKYEGTFVADGNDIFKIKVSPLRKGDPLFNGFIYISSADYQIYGVDLFITKDAQIEFVDTLFLQQEMTTENNILVPLQLKIFSHIKIFGFKATDLSVASMSNYNVNPVFGNKYFNYEVFSIDKSANKKDTQYWNTTRTITLTEEEDKHYKKSDSIYAAQNTPEYLDSMDRKRNKFTLTKLLISGYSYSKENDTIWKSFSTGTLPLTIGYNTVEGTFINYRLNYYKYNHINRRYTSITPIIRYGFINKNLALGLTISKSLHPKTSTSIGIKAGSFIQQYNEAEPINSLLNTAYTLFDRLNYAKLIQKNMLGITLNRELFNGFYTSLNVQWHERLALTNNANYSFASESKRKFTSNNPLAPLNDAPAFKTHQSFEYKISARYVHKQKYESYPDYKRILSSKYPDVYASFKHGIALNGLTFNYQQIEVGTGKDIELKMLGIFSFDVNAGMFLNNSNMAFADYKHFNGNQTMFLSNPPNLNVVGNNKSRERLTSFHALNYYTLSTQNQYLEIHALQNFRSFFVGKVPLLRKTRAYELAGINLLQTSNNKYTEAFVGLANIFSVLRVDAGRVISNNANNNWFFRFSLGLSF
jgi:oligopeptidase B